MNNIQRESVIPIPMGGLGNQIFIYVAAYIVHKETNRPMYVFKNPPSNNKHNRRRIDYNHIIFKYMGTHINVVLSPRILKLLTSSGFIFESKNPTDGFRMWSVPDTSDGILMNSYYQYYPPIIKYEDEIRSILLRGLEMFINNLRVGADCAFLHIRRGDYLQYSEIHYIQPIEYYSNAVNKLLSINPNIKLIYIVSDAMAWVKTVPFFSSSLFVYFDSDCELQTMALMAKCKGGAICANSTFSWWGAFLGAHSCRAPVIVPKKWISTPIVDLFPKEWIICE